MPPYCPVMTTPSRDTLDILLARINSTVKGLTHIHADFAKPVRHGVHHNPGPGTEKNTPKENKSSLSVYLPFLFTFQYKIPSPVY